MILVNVILNCIVSRNFGIYDFVVGYPDSHEELFIHTHGRGGFIYRNATPRQEQDKFIVDSFFKMKEQYGLEMILDTDHLKGNKYLFSITEETFFKLQLMFDNQKACQLKLT